MLNFLSIGEGEEVQLVALILLLLTLLLILLDLLLVMVVSHELFTVAHQEVILPLLVSKHLLLEPLNDIVFIVPLES